MRKKVLSLVWGLCVFGLLVFGIARLHHAGQLTTVYTGLVVSVKTWGDLVTSGGQRHEMRTQMQSDSSKTETLTQQQRDSSKNEMLIQEQRDKSRTDTVKPEKRDKSRGDELGKLGRPDRIMSEMRVLHVHDQRNGESDVVVQGQADDEGLSQGQADGIHVIVVFPLVMTDAWKNHGYNISNREVLKTRELEYVGCLQSNLQLRTVTKIHVFSDQPAVLAKKLLQEYKIDLKKVYIHQSSVTPTYFDMFKYASDNLQNKLVFIVNGDNILGKGFESINTTWWRNTPNVMYALTRHRMVKPGCNMGKVGYCGVSYIGSHDGFLFYLHKPLPDEFLKELLFVTNSYGSENVIIWAFQQVLRFSVSNPCLRLVIYHNHCSDVRPLHIPRVRVNVGGKSGLARYSF